MLLEPASLSVYTAERLQTALFHCVAYLLTCPEKC